VQALMHHNSHGLLLCHALVHLCHTHVQQVLVRAIARFRAELILEPNCRQSSMRCEPLDVQLRLYHARSTTQLDRDGDVEEQSLKHFSIVAIQTLRMQEPLSGGSGFFPVTFDDWHFCFCPLVVHTALLEFKLRASIPAAQKSPATLNTTSPRTAWAPSTRGVLSSPKSRRPVSTESKSFAALPQILASLIGGTTVEPSDVQLKDAACAMQECIRMLVKSFFLLEFCRLSLLSLGSYKQCSKVVTPEPIELPQGVKHGAIRDEVMLAAGYADSCELPPAVPMPPPKLGADVAGDGAGVAVAAASGSEPQLCDSENDRQKISASGIELDAVRLIEVQGSAPAPADGLPPWHARFTSMNESAAQRLVEQAGSDFEACARAASVVADALEFEGGEQADMQGWGERALSSLNQLSEQVWTRWQMLLEELPAHGDALVEELGKSYVRARSNQQAQSVFTEVRLIDQRAYLRQGKDAFPRRL